MPGLGLLPDMIALQIPDPKLFFKLAGLQFALSAPVLKLLETVTFQLNPTAHANITRSA